MPESPIIQIDSLTRRYDARVALDRLSLDVPESTLLALLGPNGSGKSTLFHILATLLKPTAGTARIAGHDVVTEQVRVRTQLGVLFQRPALDRRLTVRENLRHQGHLYGLRGAGLGRRIIELLERFGVADRAEDIVDTLSGGLRRRAELAKALLHHPRVLLLDEPSTGLDPGARLTLIDYLCELRQRDGVTVLLATHLMEEADRCDRVAILHQGKLVALDSPAALKDTIGGDVLTLHAARPVELASEVSRRFSIAAHAIDGSVRVERSRGHELIPAILDQFRADVESITVGKPTLEDVFVHLTGRRMSDIEPSANSTPEGSGHAG